MNFAKDMPQTNPPTYASHIGDTRVSPCQTFFFWDVGGLTNFFLGWPQTTILLFSISQVSGITDMNHHTQIPYKVFL
jgi:hypothetical protein